MSEPIPEGTSLEDVAPYRIKLGTLDAAQINAAMEQIVANARAGRPHAPVILPTDACIDCGGSGVVYSSADSEDVEQCDTCDGPQSHDSQTTEGDTNVQH